MSDAPNFDGNYPGAGAMIGPAWRAAWAELERDPERWHPRTELVAAMLEAAPSLQPKSASALLRAAARAGVIAGRYPRPRVKRNPEHRML